MTAENTSPEMVSLDAELAIASDFHDEISRELGGLPIPPNTRVRTASILFTVGISHQRAIIDLLRKGTAFYPSAFALARSCFEAHIRAFWLNFIATDEQLKNFLDGDPARNLPSPRAISAEIDSKFPSGSTATHSSKFNDNWRTLCGFTHSGSQVVATWSEKGFFEPSFPESDVRILVRFVSEYALMSASRIAEVAGDSARSEKIWSVGQGLMDKWQKSVTGGATEQTAT